MGSTAGHPNDATGRCKPSHPPENENSEGWENQIQGSLKKLKPVATIAATGFCSPQNNYHIIRISGGRKNIFKFFQMTLADHRRKAGEEWFAQQKRCGFSLLPIHSGVGRGPLNRDHQYGAAQKN